VHPGLDDLVIAQDAATTPCDTYRSLADHLDTLQAAGWPRSGSTATRGSRGETVYLGVLPALPRSSLVERLLGLVGWLPARCLLDDRLHRRADPDSLPHEILDLLDASDLLLAIKSVPARRASRAQEPVPMLPSS